MSARQASSPGGRKLLLSSGIALLLVVGAFFLWTWAHRERERPAPAPSDLAASTGLAGGPGTAQGPTPTTVPGETALLPEEKKPAPAEVVPSLVGRVLGEGRGIPRAAVLLFGVSRVEELVDHLVDLAPTTGEMPDIEDLVGKVRGELDQFRKSAITTTTDEKGDYRLVGLKPGAYYVLALAEEWLFRYGDVATVVEGQTQTLDLPLERGAEIAGRVVGLGGEPVPRATVVAELRPPNMAGLGLLFRRALRYVNGEFLRGPFEALAGTDGSFSIKCLPPGVYDLAAYQVEGVEARLSQVETGTTDAILALGRPAALRARFVDGQGLPAAKLTIRLETREEGGQPSLPIPGMEKLVSTFNRYLGARERKALTGARGELALGGLSPGLHKLTVETSGVLPWEREIELDWGRTLDLGVLTLDRGGAITGSVTDEGGTAIRGAKVLASSTQTGFQMMGPFTNDFLTDRLSDRTGADGSFRIGGLQRGAYRLVVTAPGFIPALKKKVSTDADPVHVKLRRGMEARGTVVAEADNTPIRGARVKAGRVSTRTDDDGHFLLVGLVPTSAEIEPLAGPGGFEQQGAREGTTVEIEASAPGFLSEDEDVDLAKQPARVDLRLKVMPQLEGVVLDPDGKPAPGSMVRLTPGFPAEFPSQLFDPAMVILGAAVTNLEGKFTIKGFRGPGKKADLRIVADHVLHARGFSRTFTLREALGQETPLQLEVKLERACSVRGVVTTGAAPAPRAVVRLAKVTAKEGNRDQFGLFLNMLGLPRGGEVAYTNAEGKFEYRKLLPGDYTVSAELAGFTESPLQKISLEPGGEREVTLTIDPGGEISGLVEDAGGNPLQGARVRLFKSSKEKVDSKEQQFLDAQVFFGGSYKSTRTDPEGTFFFQGLPPAQYALRVELPGFAPGEVSGLALGAPAVKVVLEPSATLAIKVVDAATGQPVKTFSVQVIETALPPESPRRRMAEVQTREVNDVEGTFERSDLRGVEQNVAVSAPGYTPLGRSVLLAPGARREELFALEGAGKIRGVVLDLETQAPIQDVKVRLVASRSPPGPAGSAPEAGGAEEASERRRERLGAAEVARAERTASSTPEDDDTAMNQHFSEEWGAKQSTQTDASGAFELEDVPSGVHRVTLSHESYVGAFQDGVEVSRGNAAELTFRLRGGHSLRGKLRSTGGAPAPAGRLLFVRGVGGEAAGLSKTALVTDEGDFSVGGLATGTYRLKVPPQPGRKVTSEPVSVEVRADTSGVEVPYTEEDQ